MERSTPSEAAVELMSPRAEKRTEAGSADAVGAGAVVAGGALVEGTAAVGAGAGDVVTGLSGPLQATAATSSAKVVSAGRAVRRRVMPAVSPAGAPVRPTSPGRG